MDYKLINSKDMSSHEDYLTACLMGMMNLEGLEAFHIRAVELGLLKEDQECMANSIVWDLRRLKAMMHNQAESIIEILPDGFSVEESLRRFAQSHAESIKKISKSRRVKSAKAP